MNLDILKGKYTAIASLFFTSILTFTHLFNYQRHSITIVMLVTAISIIVAIIFSNYEIYLKRDDLENNYLDYEVGNLKLPFTFSSKSLKESAMILLSYPLSITIVNIYSTIISISSNSLNSNTTLDSILFRSWGLSLYYFLLILISVFSSNILYIRSISEKSDHTKIELFIKVTLLLYIAGATADFYGVVKIVVFYTVGYIISEHINISKEVKSKLDFAKILVIVVGFTIYYMDYADSNFYYRLCYLVDIGIPVLNYAIVPLLLLLIWAILKYVRVENHSGKLKIATITLALLFSLLMNEFLFILFVLNDEAILSNTLRRFGILKS